MTRTGDPVQEPETCESNKLVYVIEKLFNQSNEAYINLWPSAYFYSPITWLTKGIAYACMSVFQWLYVIKGGYTKRYPNRDRDLEFITSFPLLPLRSSWEILVVETSWFHHHECYLQPGLDGAEFAIFNCSVININTSQVKIGLGVF